MRATILALGAMVVPGTLYAVVSYQPVAIVYANTGNKAAAATIYTCANVKAIVIKDANLSYYGRAAANDNYTYIVADSNYAA